MELKYVMNYEHKSVAQHPRVPCGKPGNPELRMRYNTD